MGDNEKLAAEQAAGLRALADLIESNPDLAEHAAYLRTLNVWHSFDAKVVEAIARAGLRHGAKVQKEYGDTVFQLRLSWGPVTAELLSHRDKVCQRVVVGTETVTKKVKDPTALAAVPEIEVTEEVEKVRWDCKPLLAVEGGVSW